MFGSRARFVKWIWAAMVLGMPCDAQTQTYELANRGPLPPLRVESRIEVGGHLELAGEQDRLTKTPLSVVAKLAFEQSPLPVGDRDDDARQRVARHYQTAEATLKISKGGEIRRLRSGHETLIATDRGSRIEIVHPTAALTRDEVDLVQMIGDPLAVARWLPDRPLEIGGKYPVEVAAVQALLQLEGVADADIVAELVGVERGFAKIRANGTAQGFVDGSTTEIDVKASFLVEMKLRHVSRFNLAARERRAAGGVGPAIEAVSQLRMKLDPASDHGHLTDDLLEVLATSEGPRELLLDEPELGIKLHHDRSWYVTSRQPKRMVLRRVDGSDLLAQCNLMLMPSKAAGRQPTLAEFQKDIKFSLGERFDRFVGSEEWSTAAGLHCCQVVAHGKVDQLPVEWRYFLAAPTAGRAVAMAVSVEGEFAERLGTSDRQLIETLQLTADDPSAAESASVSSSTRR